MGPIELTALDLGPLAPAAGWVWAFFLHSSILLGAALIAYRLLRRRHPQACDVVLKCAVLAPLLTSTAGPVQGWLTARASTPLAEPPLTFASPPLADEVMLVDLADAFDAMDSYGARVEPRAIPSGELVAMGERSDADGAEAAAPAASPAAPRVEMDVSGIVAWAVPTYALVAGLILAWTFVLRRVRTHRIDGRREVDAGGIVAEANAIARRAGLRRPLRVTVSEAVAVPVAMGRSEVCLPPRALVELDDDERASMFAHEIAHLSRSDPSWLSIFRCMECVFFFQPLLRLVRRAWEDNTERLCDAWVVRDKGTGLPLARCLSRAAEWLTSPLPAPDGIAMASRRSRLVERVDALLSDPPGSSRRPRWLATAAVVLAAAATAAAIPNRLPPEPVVVSPYGCAGYSQPLTGARIMFIDTIGTAVVRYPVGCARPTFDSLLSLNPKLGDAPPRLEGPDAWRYRLEQRGDTACLFDDQGYGRLEFISYPDGVYVASARPVPQLYLGIEVQHAPLTPRPADPSIDGPPPPDARRFDLVVRRVLPGHAADRAGIRAGDVIDDIEGAAVHDLADFRRRLQRMFPQDMRLGLLRGGEHVSVTLPLSQTRRQVPPATSLASQNPCLLGAAAGIDDAHLDALSLEDLRQYAFALERKRQAVYRCRADVDKALAEADVPETAAAGDDLPGAAAPRADLLDPAAPGDGSRAALHDQRVRWIDEHLNDLADRISALAAAVSRYGACPAGDGPALPIESAARPVGADWNPTETTARLADAYADVQRILEWIDEGLGVDTF